MKQLLLLLVELFMIGWLLTALCARLEVWCCVQPLRCLPGRLCASNHASRLLVSAPGPHDWASRRSRAVRRVLRRRCGRGLHHGCLWDRSNHRGGGARTRRGFILSGVGFFFYKSLIFRGFPSKASAMLSWMRGCCRTPDMIYWSLLRSTSDMGLKEEGKESKNTCSITVVLTGIWKYVEYY